MDTKKVKYSDQELFFFIKSKKRSEFEYIYDIYSPILYGFLLNSGLSEKYSADVLQNTFSKIWSNTISIPARENNFLKWILNMTIESVKDYLQNNHRKFSIKIKNCAAISIEFTDVLQPALPNQSIA